MFKGSRSTKVVNSCCTKRGEKFIKPNDNVHVFLVDAAAAFGVKENTKETVSV